MDPDNNNVTNLNIETHIVSHQSWSEDSFRSSNIPIYQTSTFVGPNAVQNGPYRYTRAGNPTKTALEKHLATLEGASYAYVFNSGLSALHAVAQLVSCGEEIVSGHNIYGGMRRLLEDIVSKCGIKVHFVDTTRTKEIESVINASTKLVHIETPSNPLMEITDIRKVAKVCARHGVLLSVDSTVLSPYLCNPLQLGADIVVHSATKVLDGHSNTTSGVVLTNNKELADKIYFLQHAEGTHLPPMECFMLMQGMKTLAIRIQRKEENAQVIAELLESYSQLKVFYPGLRPKTDDPNYARKLKKYELHKTQARGNGSLISISTGSVAISTAFANTLKLFKWTPSYGSCNSIAHLFLNKKVNFPVDLVRLSIGIENIEDLKRDVQQALEIAFNTPTIGEQV